MGRIIIQEETTKNPITLIGKEAGICYDADISDDKKNYKRGLNCIENQHGRTWEFPSVYITIDGYSARVIRELYTHIGGAPTRLQASTRYINYSNFEYIIPKTFENNKEALSTYVLCMEAIRAHLQLLEGLGVNKEDIANLLPLGMTTTVVLKTNLRMLVDMSHQRMCSRAYWEFRKLFHDLINELSNYSEEWNTLVEMLFKPKCDFLGYCPEAQSCGRRPKKQ